MTLYDVPGSVLHQAADVVARHADRDSHPDARRELGDVARVLRRIAAMWPGMFETLEEENRVLAASLQTVRAAAAVAGDPGPGGEGPAAHPDPLLRYRSSLMEMDAWRRHLRGVDEQWAADALRTIRRAIATSAHVQGAIVDLAFAATSK